MFGPVRNQAPLPVAKTLSGGLLTKDETGSHRFDIQFLIPEIEFLVGRSIRNDIFSAFTSAPQSRSRGSKEDHRTVTPRSNIIILRPPPIFIVPRNRLCSFPKSSSLFSLTHLLFFAICGRIRFLWLVGRSIGLFIRRCVDGSATASFPPDTISISTFLTRLSSSLSLLTSSRIPLSSSGIRQVVCYAHPNDIALRRTYED